MGLYNIPTVLAIALGIGFVLGVYVLGEIAEDRVAKKYERKYHDAGS